MRKLLAVIFWAVFGLGLFAEGASAQNCTGQPSANKVCAGPSSGGGGFPGFRSLVSADLPGTPQRSVSATGGSLQTTDCGGSVIFSGATFYSFTVAAATGFDTTCRVTFRNSDPQTGTTGAKILSMTGAQMRCSGGAASSVYLWPQQTASIVRVGSTWMMECPGLWQAPQSTLVINFDPVNGSDTFGAADGLSTGSRAFATFNNALYIASEMIRANFFAQTVITFRCSVAGSACTGQTDNSSGVHFPSHGSPAGSQGRAGLTLDCNGLTFGSSASFSLFGPASIIEVQNCTFATTISLTEGSELILDVGNAFTPVSGAPNISCQSQSKVLTNGGTININAGTGGGFASVATCAMSLPAGNVLGNVTYTDATVRVQAAGYLAPFTAWVLNGFTVTGTKYTLIECGILEGSANVPGTVAGAASCTQAN